MTKSFVQEISENIFYDPQLFPFLGIDPGVPLTEDDYRISEETIKVFRNKDIYYNIDHKRFADMLDKILIENRNLDQKIKIRAILVFFILNNISGISKEFSSLLTADALQVYQDIQDGQEIDILGRESRYFTCQFFNELKKHQLLMLDVIEVIHHFVKTCSLQYDRIYKIISDVIEANEESMKPVLTEQFNFMDLNNVEERYKKDIQKLFPVILPFQIKHLDYVNSYNPEAIIPFILESDSILDFVWNVLDSTVKPRVSFRVKFSDQVNGDFIDHIYIFIERAFTEIKDEKSDLFELRNGYYWFKYHKNVTEELLHKYYCVGLLLATVVYNNYKIPFHFPRYFYKKLLHRDISPAEIELFDPEYYDYIDELINDPDVDDLNIDFAYDDFLYHHIIDLSNFVDVTDVANPSLKTITKKNKNEFIHNLTEWIFDKSIKSEFEAFEKGFLKMNLNPMLYSSFRLDELDLIFSGKNEKKRVNELEEEEVNKVMDEIKKNKKFTWDDLKKNVKYVYYDENSQTIQLFWKFFDSLDVYKQLQILKPAIINCNTSIVGFEYLNLAIAKGNTKFPTYGIDGKTLLLPEFEDYEDLSEKCKLSLL